MADATASRIKGSMVLIVGGVGFIGLTLAQLLVGMGATPVVVDSLVRRMAVPVQDRRGRQLRRTQHLRRP